MASLLQVPPERHFGYQCRCCSVVNFSGRRYSCPVCPEYNLCGDCFDANLLPEVPDHLYYHPLKVYYTRAAFQLYFEGDAEPYSADNPSLQSFKCALCEVRGLTGAALYTHILEAHRSHSDYNDYIDLIDAYNQTERMIAPAAYNQTERMTAPAAALQQDEELRENRAMAEFLLPSAGRTGRTTTTTTTTLSRRGEDGLNLAQLLVHLKMLNLTSPEFPIRSEDILKRAHSLRAQQRGGQELVKVADRFVSLIEHEVAAGLSERRMRLGGGSSGRLLQRNGAMTMLHSSNGATAGMRFSATPSRTSSRSQILNRLRGLDSMVGIEDFVLPGVGATGKYRQALLASKPPKVSQDTEDHQEQNNDFDKSRFLCSQFMVENKPTNRSLDGHSEQKANFVEALLCSMLADEELCSLPFQPLTVNAIDKESLKEAERQKELNIVPWKPQEMPIPPQPYMNDMVRFYKALDEFKANMENSFKDPSTEPGNGGENNDQLSIMEVPLDSNSDGDGSGLQGNENESASSDVSPGNQEPTESDSELLELTMASIIQGIDAIIDEDGGF